MYALCDIHHEEFVNGRAYVYNRTAIQIILIHKGRVTHICVSKQTIIVSDHGSSPDRCQDINRTNPRILLIGPSGKNFSVILIEIHQFSCRKMHLKMLCEKWQPFCLGLNMLIPYHEYRPKETSRSWIMSPYSIDACFAHTHIFYDAALRTTSLYKARERIYSSAK